MDGRSVCRFIPICFSTDQERDLLRAFRARLFDVQTELEKEKNKTDDGASAWIEKSRQLEAEVDWAKEVSYCRSVQPQWHERER